MFACFVRTQKDLLNLVRHLSQPQRLDEPEFSPKNHYKRIRPLVPETDLIPGDLRINCQYGEQIVDTFGIPWILVKVFLKKWARKKKET